MTAGPTVRLSDLCDLISEPVDPGTRSDALYLGLEHLAPGRLVRTGGGQASDVRSAKSAFRPGDVLYGKLRPYLDKAVLVNEEGICTTELLVLRAKAGVDSRFLAAVVHSPAFVQHALAGTKGVQHPRTSWVHVREFDVPGFAADEQQRIAGLVWLVHRAITEQETCVATARALKRAAMQTLFTRGLRGEAQKETEVGPVPGSWDVVSFASVREKLQYGTSVRCTYDVSDRPVLRIPNIEPQRINSGDLKYCTLTGSNAAKYQLEENDLIFIRTNGILDRLGLCAVYTGHPANALFASYLIRARMKLAHVNPHFPAFFFGSEMGTSIVAGRATPASDGKFNLNTATIDSLPLPLPPTLSEQGEIVAILDAIDRKIDLHRRKRAVLDDLFKALLHKLMTGEIRVANLNLSSLLDGAHGCRQGQRKRKHMEERKVMTPGIDRHPGDMNEFDEQASSRREIPSPRALMRVRHPDLFSDTRVDDVSHLPKAVFEYHLDTLTSRKQEYQFEHFCRKLAEQEICPNLRIQTGPTGGGDSKVDDETYPVAEEIAERWWTGSPSAGVERWAFAFSAKKRWKPKVKADVKNILSTERNYKRIYFFTNQFVRDKDRSAYEDTLLRDTGIPVHIMDRSWTVEKVYEAPLRHLDTYLAALGIEDVPQESKSRTGPRDAARLEELEQLDQQIADPSRYQGAHYQLVEDCLRSAILARSLERSRSEVESRFERASRLAADVNHNQQRLRIAYNRAWTAYWWHEDYTEFSEFFEDVEKYAKESTLASDVDLLLNLWMLSVSLMAEGEIETQNARFEARSQCLATMLEAMAADSARPNNALQARTSLILMQTTQAYHSERFDEVENGWSDLVLSPK